MLRTHVNCNGCKNSLGDLYTPDGVNVEAFVLTCPKCGNLGGYKMRKVRRPKKGGFVIE